MAVAVYQTALVSSGYEYNKKLFTDHVFGFMRVMMKVPDNATVDEDFDVAGFEEEDEEMAEEKQQEGHTFVDADGNPINFDDVASGMGAAGSGEHEHAPEEEDEEEQGQEGMSEL